MANDRIFVVCDWCGGHKILGKYYPSTGADVDGADFEAFYEQHRDCHPQHSGDVDLGPRLGLSLMCEAEFCKRGGVIGDPSPITLGTARRFQETA